MSTEHICATCGHLSFNHSRVGFPIDHPFPRCLHRKFFLFLWTWCKCWRFVPTSSDAGGES